MRIHNRMKKLQRPKRLAGGPASNERLNKKQKTSNCGWSEHPDLPEGETLASLADYSMLPVVEVSWPGSRMISDFTGISWTGHLP